MRLDDFEEYIDDSRILARGRNYFEESRVRNVKKLDQTTYSAAVEGEANPGLNKLGQGDTQPVPLSH
ncbi:MAG: hypothetical protein ACOX4Q_10350 [Syntrophomonadales bacterium]